MLNQGNDLRLWVLVGSLSASIILFTFLLKVSSLLVDVPPETWSYLSGLLLALAGGLMAFPKAWEWVQVKVARTGYHRLPPEKADSGYWQTAMLGAALGPVFNSCSPTYAVILATVLPADPVSGLIYLISYIFGMVLLILLIAYLGSKASARLKWLAHPDNAVKKAVGGLLVIFGILIATGWEQSIELKMIDAGMGTNPIETLLLDKMFGRRF